MSPKKFFYHFAVVLTALSFFLSAEILGAQTGKKVVFPKGKNFVSYTGRLPKQSGDYDYYLLRAKSKQTLSVKLKTEDSGAYIQIYETKNLGPTEDLISGENNSSEWSGKLPITSEYSIQVYCGQNGSSRTPYTIEISLR